MNRIRKVLIGSFALVMLLSLFFAAGCGKSAEPFDESSLPKAADDNAVIEQWSAYPALDGIPRYVGGGLFDTIAELEDGGVNVYYNLTTEDDYLDYNSNLKSSGFKLKNDSAIWVSEGSLGAPVYVKGDTKVTLVWSYDGQFAICVKHGGE